MVNAKAVVLFTVYDLNGKEVDLNTLAKYLSDLLVPGMWGPSFKIVCNSDGSFAFVNVMESLRGNKLCYYIDTVSVNNGDVVGFTNIVVKVTNELSSLFISNRK